ncbi:MAG: hypothetical protein EBR09_13255 [Proteobacteria bacterium]|nr:hypothetical protein [Pseudomonadota bacterium]
MRVSKPADISVSSLSSVPKTSRTFGFWHVRLLTKPINSPLIKNAENLTAMQVIPKKGSLSEKKVWIIGNLTTMTRCRTPDSK